MKIAVILFPGTNCENESKRALEFAGMNADIVRWNESNELEKYDGYLLPGGWSYEDRIRAGVISAKDPIMNTIKKEADKGKVVIGICNGCQILVESGLIPNVNSDNVEMALAPNNNPFIDGFYCRWVNLKNSCSRDTAFNIGLDNVIPMPIAHGEGRFVTKDNSLIEQLKKNEQILFQYCDDSGNVMDSFPINPNEIGRAHV